MNDKESVPKKRGPRKGNEDTEYIKDAAKRRIYYEKAMTAITKKYILLCCKTGCDGMLVTVPNRLLNPIVGEKQIRRGLDSNMNITATRSDMFNLMDQHLEPRDFDSVVGKADLYEKIGDKVSVPRMVEDRTFDQYTYRGDIPENGDIRVVKRGRPAGLVTNSEKKTTPQKKKKKTELEIPSPIEYDLFDDDDLGCITEED